MSSPHPHILPLSDLLDQRVFPDFEALEAPAGKPLHVAGLAGSAASALVAAQFHRAEKSGDSILYLAPDAKDAEAMAEDLVSWLGEDSVLHFPGLELKPYEWREPFGQVRERRLETFEALYRRQRAVVVLTAAAFLEKFQSPQSLHREIVEFRAGDALDPAAFREAAGTLGFQEEAAVQDLGDFSVRGEILDIYPYLAENPFRIVLDGDVIESIREFDIFSQRSLRAVDSVALLPQDECCYTAAEIEQGLLDNLDRLGGTEEALESELHRLLRKRDLTGIHWQKAFFKKLDHSLLDFTGPGTRVIVGDSEGLARAVEKTWEAARAGHAEALEHERFVNAPEELFLTRADVERLLDGRRVIQIGRIAFEGSRTGAGSRTFEIEPQRRGGAGLADIEPFLRDLAASGMRAWLLSPNAGQAERLWKMTEALGVEGVCIGHLASGFVDRDQGVALLTDHQIFNRMGRTARKRKFRGGGVAIPDFDALHRGDFVVHETYGVGRFVGIRRLNMGGNEVDCILLDYQGNDKLTLPVGDLAKLEKFSGEEGHEPLLSRLGGKAWENAKERTRKAIVVLVRELIELYARRSLAKGFAFSPDGEMQKEFEAAFEYDLTPDQAKAIAETKRDMEADKPMDRLICGDVGFGKTEVAMRAAFKALVDKKQVALMAPTTILAAQHFETLSERFSGWPVRIAALHRFVSAKEQKEALAALARGEVDVLVGTHRLLSKDVAFKDLGLLIVDEEQKFGVKQKERLKALRAEVDVLALSATPIPRTLHLSLLGTRDLSIIATPPRNRLPIETRVLSWNPDAVREAIEAEMERGGQTFFVHNRVQDMHEMADKVAALVPNGRVGVAHGQMEEGELERVMSAFINREYDVLCCTAIIESGIDIPNANTLIVHRADLFGLSQLYQLRGRVGRSAAQAHCLLLSPDANRFSDDARRKLFALEKFTDLGSGFQIAMRDLEIRGAGNLLGLEQSGHIAAVGFETYVRMVQEAVLEMQGQTPKPPLNPEIEFPVDAFLPEEYIEDSLQRTTLYQKIARLESFPEAAEMERELEDRFGKLPEETRMLLRTVEARIACRQCGFRKAEIRENALVLTFSEKHLPAREELSALASRIKRPSRFLYGDPLQLRIDLNPPRRNDTVALTLQAVEALKQMAGEP
ncbi:MAG: transcription-repair coupling factor [Fibrobacteria bacterium]|jgi:transcription-repair coupling factor (superfamily II helicase)|nr:transcription-repair coupling factor [Fibrobacteria bacterium]